MTRAILIVDDEPTLRSVLAEVLANEGFSVRTASNGAAALAEQSRDPADVIISDMMMPVLDGTTLVRELRARGDETPVILMSAVGPRHPLPPGIPFVRKPFDIEQLLVMVNETERTHPHTPVSL